MTAFTKAEVKISSKFFWFADQTRWRPYNITLDPSNKTIVANAVTEVYRPAQLGLQLEYHQQLLRVVNSSCLTETNFIQANVY